VPVLFVSPDSWESSTLGNGSPGLPIYLAQFDRMDVLVNGACLSGGVQVSGVGSPAPTKKPSTPDGWNNFEHFILNVSEMFPRLRYSAANADDTAPSGVLTLTGGNLGSAPPSSSNVERPWQVLHRLPHVPSTIEQALFTDIAVYSFTFDAGDAVTIQLHSSWAGQSVVNFRPDTDIQAWIAHEPWGASLSPTRSSSIQHLHVVANFFDKPPLEEELPIIRIDPNLPNLNPDDRACPPFQIRS
jgi:hypothetical protein